MNQKHILNLLPLWVGGDLSRREAESVKVHLSKCESCRAASEALQASQAWLKRAPEAPFDATDFAELRKEVMATIRAHPNPSFREGDGFSFFRQPSALAAACATVLVVASSFWMLNRHHTGPLSPSSPVATQAPAPPLGPLPAPLPSPSAGRAPLHRYLPKPAPQLAANPVESVPSRIEIQTSNPQIRIIWLARALPAPGPLYQPTHPS